MTTATIRCPKCGHEFNVVPEDLDKIDLHYECPSCKEDISVDFFDFCPTCKKKVGFLEGGAFKNDMINIGTTIAKGLFNPFSAVGTIGGMIYDSVVNDSKNSIGNGICPYCNLRFIRCYSCHELTPIPLNATFKDTFKCRSCGVYLNPNASVGDVGDMHSKDFINENNKESMTTNNTNPLLLSVDSVFEGADNKVYCACTMVTGKVSVGDYLVMEINSRTLFYVQVTEIIKSGRSFNVVTEHDCDKFQICINADYEKVKDTYIAYNLYENGGLCWFNSEVLSFGEQANKNIIELIDPEATEFEMIQLHKTDIEDFIKGMDFVSETTKVAFHYLISLYALYYIHLQIEGNKQAAEQNNIEEAIKKSNDAISEFQPPSNDIVLHKEEYELILLLNDLLTLKINNGAIEKINSKLAEISELKSTLNDNNTFLPIKFWNSICTSLITPKGYVLKGHSSDGSPVYGHDEFTDKTFRMTVEDVFYVNTDNGGRCILTGCIEDGCVHPNDKIYLNGGNSVDFTTVIGIELHRKFVSYAEKGDNVGIVISPDFENIVFKGMIVSSDEIVPSNSMEITANEQEFLNGIREFLEDDAEITPRERKMLDRIRLSLGISEERAKELEASLAKPQVTEEEQEYIEAYRDYLINGSIDEKSRKRLDIFRKGLGISEG